MKIEKDQINEATDLKTLLDAAVDAGVKPDHLHLGIVTQDGLYADVIHVNLNASVFETPNGTFVGITGSNFVGLQESIQQKVWSIRPNCYIRSIQVHEHHEGAPEYDHIVAIF